MSEETAREAAAQDPGPAEGIRGEGVEPRRKWANNWEFILCMAGAIIGPGSFWRFPYLCYKNGGGVFLIPYFVFFFLCGIPLFFLETALGQYTSEGGVTAWRKICPMFQGVGIASQVIVTYLNVCHIVILAWTLFYVFSSFQSPLPWALCDNLWNTDTCQTTYSSSYPYMFDIDSDSDWTFLNNVTSPDSDNFNLMNYTSKSSEMEFWTNRVLRMSDDMSVTRVYPDLALCLLLAWVMCYFCVWKGIRSTGKVVYFTATFPYLLLFIIFIRGVTLPGAGEGLRYYLYPEFSKLADPSVWSDAAQEVVFSFGICQGVMTALGSYNKYNNNCYRDCLALCCLNSVTSIFAGFAVFSVLGFIAHQMHISIDDVVSAGPYLAFISFPKALSMMPVPFFWTVLFFCMLFFLTLDTQFLWLESLATAITDMFPRQLRRPHARKILVLVIAGVCFLLGLPFVSDGGLVIFNLVDMYGSSEISLLIIAIAETVVIAWVYGADRFCDNIEDMIGHRPFGYPMLKYCWLFITPFICGLTLLFSLTQSYSIKVYDYVPDTRFYALGCLLIATPLMCIPAFILISLYKDGQNMTTPSGDLRQARPHKPILTMCQSVIFRAQGQPNRSVDERNEKIMMEEPRV